MTTTRSVPSIHTPSMNTPYHFGALATIVLIAVLTSTAPVRSQGGGPIMVDFSGETSTVKVSADYSGASGGPIPSNTQFRNCVTESEWFGNYTVNNQGNRPSGPHPLGFYRSNGHDGYETGSTGPVLESGTSRFERRDYSEGGRLNHRSTGAYERTGTDGIRIVREFYDRQGGEMALAERRVITCSGRGVAGGTAE